MSRRKQNQVIDDFTAAMFSSVRKVDPSTLQKPEKSLNQKEKGLNAGLVLLAGSKAQAKASLPVDLLFSCGSAMPNSRAPYMLAVLLDNSGLIESRNALETLRNAMYAAGYSPEKALTDASLRRQIEVCNEFFGKYGSRFCDRVGEASNWRIIASTKKIELICR